METTQRSITQTQEKITQTQEKITEAEEKRSDYQVTAEMDGKIIMVGVQEGEAPRQAGQTAVTLYNLDSMTITPTLTSWTLTASPWAWRWTSPSPGRRATPTIPAR